MLSLFRVRVFGKFYKTNSILPVRNRCPDLCSGTIKRIDCIKCSFVV